MTDITTQGLTVVDDGVDRNVMVMLWGATEEPIYTAMTPGNALRLSADLIAAATRRIDLPPRPAEPGN